jgi:fatty acid desaturase
MAAAFDDARTGTTWSTPNDHRTDADGSAESSASRGSEYAELSRRVRGAGLLDRRPAYYTAKIGLNLVLLAAGWTAFVLLGDSWSQLIVAAWLALVAGQVAFVGHDAGHRQIFRTRRPNDLVGLAHANLLVGVSFGWWVGKHNRHHSNPNHEDRDPDINVGAVAFTRGQARARRGLAKLLARYQAYLFFPMLLGEAVHLHAASVRALLRGTVRHAPVEAGLLLIHLAGSLTALLLVLSPLRAAVFLIVQQGLLGLYLGCAFAPNHKGMPILTEDDELDFLRRQVLTSRNVRGGPLVDFALGGLNYQIEHHLFPSMPRPSLRRAQPLVRAFCREHGLPYCEEPLIGSYGAALRHLKTVAAPPRPAVADQPSSG